MHYYRDFTQNCKGYCVGIFEGITEQETSQKKIIFTPQKDHLCFESWGSVDGTIEADDSLEVIEWAYIRNKEESIRFRGREIKL